MVYERTLKDNKVGFLCRDGIVFPEHDCFGIDSDTFGCVVCFIDADETIRNLKHVVPQGDDDELGVLCLFLQKEKHVLII